MKEAIDYVARARARALQPLVREAADRAEADRRLPAHVAEAMAKEGLYRVAAPASYGGAEATPQTQIGVIEAISEADGSAGWNVMIGIETFGMLGMVFDRGVELFADPMTIVCGSTAAAGRAECVDGGYRVTGRWPFASGCHNAQYFGGIVVFHENGEPVAGELPGYAIHGPGDWEILDTWNVSGLRGSGSHDVTVEDVFVPTENVAPFAPMAFAENRERSPLLRLPMNVRLAYNKVGVGLGIARAAIDAFVELATGKHPRFSSGTLRERPFAQRAIAMAEVRLRSARALVFELAAEMWEHAVAGEDVTLRDRALFQIACSDAAAACAEAVDTLAEAAGTSANFVACPLERQARDARVIRQHMTVAPHHIEDGGRVLLGLDPQAFMLSVLR